MIPRVTILWADVRALSVGPFDFIVDEPALPRGGQGKPRRSGAASSTARRPICATAASCWLVANRHLPYEAALEQKFRSVAPIAAEGGYKVIEAIK